MALGRARRQGAGQGGAAGCHGAPQAPCAGADAPSPLLKLCLMLDGVLIIEQACIFQAQCGQVVRYTFCHANLQGQKEVNALADACKGLGSAASGKAAAKRAGKALQKVLKEAATATQATQAPGGAGAGGAAATPVPLRLSPAGSPSRVRQQAVILPQPVPLPLPRTSQCCTCTDGVYLGGS